MGRLWAPGRHAAAQFDLPCSWIACWTSAQRLARSLKRAEPRASRQSPSSPAGRSHPCTAKAASRRRPPRLLKACRRAACAQQSQESAPPALGPLSGAWGAAQGWGSNARPVRKGSRPAAGQRRRSGTPIGRCFAHRLAPWRKSCFTSTLHHSARRRRTLELATLGLVLAPAAAAAGDDAVAARRRAAAAPSAAAAAAGAGAEGAGPAAAPRPDADGGMKGGRRSDGGGEQPESQAQRGPSAEVDSGSESDSGARAAASCRGDRLLRHAWGAYYWPGGRAPRKCHTVWRRLCERRPCTGTRLACRAMPAVSRLRQASPESASMYLRPSHMQAPRATAAAAAAATTRRVATGGALQRGACGDQTRRRGRGRGSCSRRRTRL